MLETNGRHAVPPFSWHGPAVPGEHPEQKSTTTGSEQRRAPLGHVCVDSSSNAVQTPRASKIHGPNVPVKQPDRQSSGVVVPVVVAVVVNVVVPVDVAVVVTVVVGVVVSHRSNPAGHAVVPDVNGRHWLDVVL